MITRDEKTVGFELTERDTQSRSYCMTFPRDYVSGNAEIKFEDERIRFNILESDEIKGKYAFSITKEESDDLQVQFNSKHKPEIEILERGGFSFCFSDKPVYNGTIANIYEHGLYVNFCVNGSLNNGFVHYYRIPGCHVNKELREQYVKGQKVKVSLRREEEQGTISLHGIEFPTPMFFAIKENCLQET